MTKRNINLVWHHEVKVEGREVAVSSGEFRGGVRYECKAKLSMWSAGHLVNDVRKAMRQIRKEQIAELNRAVAHAEEEMP
jgi:hypothetical protein